MRIFRGEIVNRAMALIASHANVTLPR